MCRGIRGSEATGLLNVGLSVGMFKGSALNMLALLKVMDVGVMNLEKGNVKSNW